MLGIMRIILARASARYTGRIETDLGLGDVIIQIRSVESGGDGSVLVHDIQKGLQPRNWMPAESVLEDQGNILVFTHRKGERLEIYLDTVYLDHVQSGEMIRAEMVKTGTEREFSDLLVRKLHLVDPNLTVGEREYRTPAGPLDILCLDSQNNDRPVCIECKRVKVSLSDVYQARRYLHSLDMSPEWEGLPPARAVLVAPSLQKNAKALIDRDERLSFKRLSARRLPGRVSLHEGICAAASELDTFSGMAALRRALPTACCCVVALMCASTAAAKRHVGGQTAAAMRSAVIHSVPTNSCNSGDKLILGSEYLSTTNARFGFVSATDNSCTYAFGYFVERPNTHSQSWRIAVIFADSAETCSYFTSKLPRSVVKEFRIEGTRGTNYFGICVK
jgi:RecB family endonuclease NucS